MAMELRDRTDEAVRAVIDRWLVELCERNVDGALAMLVPSKQWTPELLATVIRNYGSIDPFWDGRTFQVTAPESATGKGPRFNVTWFEGSRSDGFAGYAHYDLPLNGEWSDVTASFDIVETRHGLCLALDDIHVM
jgi:hypothetical protein